MRPEVVVVLLCHTAFLAQAKSHSKRRLLSSSFAAVPRELRHCSPPVGISVTEARVQMYGKSDVRAFATITPLPGTKPVNATAFTIDNERCLDEVRTSNNCEYFARWKFPRLCDMLETKGQFWTPFTESFTPALRCPVGGISYKVENATFDISKFVLPLNVPTLSGQVWTSRIGVQGSKGEEVFCFEFEFTYRRT